MMSIRISVQDETKKPYPWELDGMDWVKTVRTNPFANIDATVTELGLKKDTFYVDDTDMRIGRKDPIFLPTRPTGASINGILHGFWRWLQRCSVIEEGEQFETWEFPFYIFDSPAIKQSKTTITTTKNVGAMADWSISVFGNGFGSDFTVSINQSSQFTSSSGQHKLVFAPLRVRIIRVALYRDGVLENHFLRTELAESDLRDADGIRSLDEEEWSEFITDNQLKERFDLSGDKSNDIAIYKRKYSLSGNFNASLGFKALDLESTVAAKVSTEKSVEVSLSLPPGNTYQLMMPSKISGFFFESE